MTGGLEVGIRPWGPEAKGSGVWSAEPQCLHKPQGQATPWALQQMLSRDLQGWVSCTAG